MKPSRINLVEYFATDLALATNRSFAPDKPVEFRDSDLAVDVSVQQNEHAPRNGSRWQVSVDLRHQAASEANFPYSYRVVLVGQFSVSENVKPEDEKRFVRIQGASVLYGMAREIVRALTGRGPYRPVILPTVSFYTQADDGSSPTEPPAIEPAKTSSGTTRKKRPKG